MGCLNVKATLLNSPVQVDFDLLERISCDAKILNKPLIVTTKNITSKIKINCSIVCSIGDQYYLTVDPDVVWLTRDMLSSEFNIYSNVSWNIN